VLDAGGVTLTSVSAAAKGTISGVGSPSEMLVKPEQISRPGGRSDEH